MSENEQENSGTTFAGEQFNGTLQHALHLAQAFQEKGLPVPTVIQAVIDASGKLLDKHTDAKLPPKAQVEVNKKFWEGFKQVFGDKSQEDKK